MTTKESKKILHKCRGQLWKWKKKEKRVIVGKHLLKEMQTSRLWTYFERCHYLECDKAMEMPKAIKS